VTSANATTIGANVPFAHSGKITVSTPFGGCCLNR
jgi:hypothetical protein